MSKRDTCNDVPEVTLLPVEGDEAVLRLSGTFKLAAKPASLDVQSASSDSFSSLRIVDDGINEWDSALLAFVVNIKKQCEGLGASVDYSGLPAGAMRLLDLAMAVPDRTGAKAGKKQDGFITRVGSASIQNVEAGFDALTFLGEATISLLRFFVGRARYRKAEFWLIVQQCGPQALGIITTISLLVGAILAFVGSVQLKMFGAEVFVANLVGLGMVMEMGALMTGIILAGRTGASFAAQLGTMQVNEEIDALKTMGIPPMDYLVMPRMVALAIMTPLLVIYSDILGIRLIIFLLFYHY